MNPPISEYMPSASRETCLSFPPRHTPPAPRHFFLAASVLLSIVAANTAAAEQVGGHTPALPSIAPMLDLEPMLRDAVEEPAALPATRLQAQPITAAVPQKFLRKSAVVNVQHVVPQELPVPQSGKDSFAEEVRGKGPDDELNSESSFGLKPMSQISVDIALPKPTDELPENIAGERFSQEEVIAHAEFVGRDWATIDYRWDASLLCHGPILFEQLNAERYGITYGCLQPVVSGAHFFATVPILPYKVWAQGHDHCQYALGYYRPGSCATPQCYKPRISADASLFEAGVILGLIYALP